MATPTPLPPDTVLLGLMSSHEYEDDLGFFTIVGEMRNDLQEAAIEAEPIIEHVFNTLAVTPGCMLTRMSGSGGTCFGLYGDAETAASAAGRLNQDYPGWWVVATQLNAAA